MGRRLKLGAAGLAFLLYLGVAAVRRRDEVRRRKAARRASAVSSARLT